MSANLNQKPVYEITIAGVEKPVQRMNLREWMPPVPNGKTEWSKEEIQEFTLDMLNNATARKWTAIEKIVELDEAEAAPYREHLANTQQAKKSISDFQAAARKYEAALKVSKAAADERNKAFCQMIADSEKVNQVLVVWQDYRGTTKIEQIINLFQGKFAHLATENTVKLLEEAEANRIARK